MRAVTSGNPASIPVTLPVAASSKTSANRFERHRTLLLGLAAARAAIAAAALPMAPWLYEEHVPVLVLLRPSKEVLLFAGFAAQRGDAPLPLVVAAALPLLLGAVWVMFALGRSFADELEDDGRTGLSRRLLPPKRIRPLVRALRERGATVVFLGRLAAFPSTLVGAAAGGAGMPTRTFLLADLAGALLTLVVFLGTGFVLEEAHDAAGPWLTGAGAAVVALVALVLGRSLKQAGRAP